MGLKQGFTRAEVLELASEFKRRRKFLNLTQAMLSKKSGLSQSVITKFERGLIDPVYSTVVKIDTALCSLEKESNLKVSAIMVCDVLNVVDTDTLFNALKIMRQFDFSQLLVLDVDGKVLGSIYEKDILDLILDGVDINKEFVGNHLNLPPIIISSNFLISDVYSLFANRKVKYLLVMDCGVVKGIVTKSDLFKVQ